MVKPIVPCLYFNGNCHEAMTFYHQCFGGDLGITTAAETTIGGDLPEDMRNRVVTAQVTSGSFILLAADTEMQPLAAGSHVQLTVECDGATEAGALFYKLAEGGEVTSKLSEQFWGAMVGELTDRYGFRWMIYYRL
jgi:PhnB protein